MKLTEKKNSEENKRKKETIQNPVFFNEEDGKWYFYEKRLTNDKQIIYQIHPEGYELPETAMKTYLESLNSFNEMMDHLKVNVTKQNFADSLKNWYHNTFVSVSSSSYTATNAYVIYHFLLPNLGKIGEKPLDKINWSDLEKLIAQTNGFCSTSQAQSYKTLKAFFTSMVLAGTVKSNPMDKVTPRYMPKPRKEFPEYTFEDVEKLLFYAKKTIHFLEVCLLLHGLRYGEIRGLHFSDFDRESKTLTIRRQAVRKNNVSLDGDGNVQVTRENIEIKATKTLISERVLRIPDVLFDLVDERKEWLDKLKADRKKKGKPWDDQYDGYLSIADFGLIKSDGTLNCALKRICSSAGIPVVTTHDLRHVTATLMFEYGTQNMEQPDLILKMVSEYLGHADIGTTFDVYTSYVESRSRIRGVVAQEDPFYSNGGKRGA